MINVVNDRLQVEHPPNGWPINAESGWQELWKVGQHFLLSKLEPNQYGWQSLFCETLSQTLQKHSFQKTYQNKFSTS